MSNNEGSRDHPATAPESSTAKLRHDLNNLLTVIHGWTEVLLATEGLSAEVSHPARQILQATDQAILLAKRIGAPTKDQPLAALPPTAPLNPPPATPAATAWLILQDDGLRRFAALVLERLGCAVQIARDESVLGPDPRETGPACDLLVTDAVAPADVDRWELWLRSCSGNSRPGVVLIRDAAVPVVIDPATQERIRVLTRPFTPDALVQAIQECLGRVG